tara:strand:- start:1466 stop:1768 length:303 start_codon:yes stop_codon:yes gene_type:complete
MKLKPTPTSNIFIYCNNIEISRDEFMIMADNLRQKENYIQYYQKYKDCLCQFMTLYRTDLTHNQMLNMLQEIQRLEILIYEIKNGKQIQKTITKRISQLV